MKDEMIALMRRLRREQEELREDVENAQILKAQIEADLEAKHQRVEEIRNQMTDMLRVEFGGQKFRVPGFGTVFFTERRRTVVEDEEAFDTWAAANLDDDDYEKLYPRKLAKGEAAKLAVEYIEDGEIVPGVESNPVRTLSVRYS